MQGDPDSSTDRAAVFVSYTKSDVRFAEWIAFELEEHGYSVIFQAWGDLRGNWVLAMDRAMKSAVRTVVVLSDAYLDSVYAAPEWANAARVDPTGEQDFVVPVRVAEMRRELQGWLAQIPYVDLVGTSEDVARDILIRRMEGRRLKPDQVGYPARSTTVEPVHEVVATRPVYPAAVGDDDYWQQVRAMLTRWRARYALELRATREAAARARDLQYGTPSEIDCDIGSILERAAGVAEDLEQLPVSDLARCAAHGLALSGAVLQGTAMFQAKSAHESTRLSPGGTFDLVVDAYGYENAARVLEAAVVLAEYDISRLPHGYREPVGRAPTVEPGLHRSLVAARGADRSMLEILSVGGVAESLGGVVARNLALTVHCARLTGSGTVDLIGSDANHLYCWWDSSQQPTVEFELARAVVAAGFLPGAAERFVVVASDGSVEILELSGKRSQLDPIISDESVNLAGIWFESETWGLVMASPRVDVWAWSSGSETPSFRAHEELWSEHLFGIDAPDRFLWLDRASLQIAEIDGFRCAVVHRPSNAGSGLWFLNPESLEPLRPPVMIPRRLADLAIAKGRWLVGAPIRSNDYGLALWDVKGPCDAPTATSLQVPEGDVYHPVVSEQWDDGSFATVQVHRPIVGDNAYKCQLVRCRWPSGTIEHLGTYDDLWLWPVETNDTR